MRHQILGLLAAATLASFTSLGQPAPPAELLHTFRLTGDVQTFSLKLINEFPFIGGTVNGQAGQFMFDTGNADAVDLNEHLLKLLPGRQLGQGSVGSGQRYTRVLHDTIRSIILSNGLSYQNLPGIEGNSYDFLEHIAPDCLGQIGAGYYEGYLIKLDYTRRQLTCYRQTEARRASQDFLRGERVLAVLDVDVRKRPGNVVGKVQIGGYEFACAFDTGQQGQVYLDRALYQQLLAKKVLEPLPMQDGDSLCTLRQVNFGHGLKVDLHALNVQSRRNQRIDAALGFIEPHLLTLGYAFLQQFTTIWDAQAHKMYVCAPR